MKTLLYTLIPVLFLVAGCQQPADVELTQDGSTAELEVLPVVIPDTNIIAAPVDSSAILPEELIRFGGAFVIHHVTLDAGTQVARFAYAAAFVIDTPERFLGRLVGYSGVDLGTLTLNGSPLIRLPHRIPVKRLAVRDTVLWRGYEYIADLTGAYQFGSPYMWQGTGGMGGFARGIQTPDELLVDAPRGGTVVSRDQDLELRWRGRRGALAIIVSAYEPLTRTTKPLLNLRSRNNTGRAIVPAKLLRQLPRLHRYYVLTFVLSNRAELPIDRQGETKLVLVQAASVVSCYIELR